jgi:hypothetical protein
MIISRPASLDGDQAYRTLLPPPYRLDLACVPEPIRQSLFHLGGIQPLTGEMAKAAHGNLSDAPSAAEIELFKRKGTEFQLIMIVANCIVVALDDHPVLRPYAVTLIPASKRDEVSHSTIDWVKHFAGKELMGGETAYVGLDPFRGDWQLYGEVGVVVGEEPRAGYMDELGLVTDHYHLATDHDPADVLTYDARIPETLRESYFRHRSKLLFTPFKAFRSRRVWGLETPIELFVLEELARRGLHPQPQMLILEDGSVFPSLYDMWHELETARIRGPLTEADLFFEEAGVAIFCDGRHHSRLRQRKRDTEIDAKLQDLGINPVRLPAREIIQDLSAAVDKISEALRKP